MGKGFGVRRVPPNRFLKTGRGSGGGFCPIWVVDFPKVVFFLKWGLPWSSLLVKRGFGIVPPRGQRLGRVGVDLFWRGEDSPTHQGSLFPGFPQRGPPLWVGFEGFVYLFFLFGWVGFFPTFFWTFFGPPGEKGACPTWGKGKLAALFGLKGFFLAWSRFFF